MQDLPAFGSRAVPVAGWPAAILKRLDGPLQLLVESLEGASASAEAVACIDANSRIDTSPAVTHSTKERETL